MKVDKKLLPPSKFIVFNTISLVIERFILPPSAAFLKMLNLINVPSGLYNKPYTKKKSFLLK